MIDLWLPPKPAIIRQAEKKLLIPALGSFLPGMFPAAAFAGSAAGALIFKGSSSQDPASDTTPITFSSFDIGTPSADRRIIVAAMTVCIVTGRTITGITVGGNALTLHVNVNSGNSFNHLAIGSALIASGSTADIVVTNSGNVAIAAVGVWLLTGETSSSPNASNSDVVGSLSGSGPTSVMTYSCAVDVPSNGALVAAACSFDDGGPGVTWTGATSDFGSRVSSVYKITGAHLSGLPSEAGHNAQLSFNNTTSDTNEGCLAALTWQYA